MPKARRLRKRFTTPPRELVPEEEDKLPQLSTPQRSAIFAVFYFCEQQKLPCNYESFSSVFNIPKTTQSRVLVSGRCRRAQHHDSIPDPRGRERILTHADALAISDYIVQAPFDEKDDTWEELAERAGVVKEVQSKRNIQYHPTTIQRRVTEATGLKTHKAVVKEKHTPAQIEARMEYLHIQLELRPHSKDWRIVLWSDELHWSTGPRYQKNVKRLPGDEARYHPSNIQYDKDHKPDPEKLHKFHLFCVVGYNFRWCIPYNSGTSNGKMNTHCYCNEILPALKKYLLQRGGEWILWQDCDSAHISKKTLEYMDINGWDYINSPPKSPDLSIMETWVSPLRRNFFKRKCTTEAAGIKRFYRVWDELDVEKINSTVNSYPFRMRKVRDVYLGKASKY